MRTIKFDAGENEILKEIISLGNSQYENYFQDIGKFIFDKIRVKIFHFDKKEVQVLRSYTSNWINNYENLIDELSEKYLGKEKIDFENITAKEREAMHKISIVFSIKSKLFSEKYITFRKVLEKN